MIRRPFSKPTCSIVLASLLAYIPTYCPGSGRSMEAWPAPIHLLHTPDGRLSPRERSRLSPGRQIFTLWPRSRVRVSDAALGFSLRLANQGGLRSTSIDPL